MFSDNKNYYGYIRRSLSDTDAQYEAQKTIVSDLIRSALYNDDFKLIDDVDHLLFEDHDKAWTHDSSLPGKNRLLEKAAEGDTIFIESIDKITSTTRNFFDVVHSINEKKATLIVADPKIISDEDPKPIIFDPINPIFENPMRIVAALASMESAITAERLAFAKPQSSEGRKPGGGRKPALNDEQIAEFKKMVSENASQLKIAKALNISQATASRYKSDLFGNGRALNPEYIQPPTDKRRKRREALKSKKSIVE